MCNLHCKFHFRSLYMDFMPRSQISFQLATPLLDFILFWLLIRSWMNLFHCGFHFRLLSHISFQLLLTLQISFQLILPLGISSHFPLQCPSQITFQKLLQFSQHTHIKRYKVYLSLSLFVFLGFWFLWLQRVSAASLQQISPPASLQQVSLASFYQVYFKKASLRTKEGPSTRMSVPELCRCKM